MRRSPRRESIARLLRTDREEAIRRLRWALQNESLFSERQLEILAEVVYCRSLAEAGRNLDLSRETIRKSVAKVERLIYWHTR